MNKNETNGRVGVADAYDGLIPAMRRSGATLREIGERCGGCSRERIRQVLKESYPESLYPRSGLVRRIQFCKQVGCSDTLLLNLEGQGLIAPAYRCTAVGTRVQVRYDIADVAKAKRLVKAYKEAHRAPRVDITCRVCGKTKTVPKSWVRPTSPGHYCSHECAGRVLGRKYGFAAHPEHARGSRSRKWDYDKVYELRDKTGWGALRLGRALGIPMPTVTMILQKRGTT